MSTRGWLMSIEKNDPHYQCLDIHESVVEPLIDIEVWETGHVSIGIVLDRDEVEALAKTLTDWLERNK